MVLSDFVNEQEDDSKEDDVLQDITDLIENFAVIKSMLDKLKGKLKWSKKGLYSERIKSDLKKVKETEQRLLNLLQKIMGEN